MGPLCTASAADNQLDSTAEDTEVVIVTGVRGSPRTVTDSPTPIDVFTSADLERTGRAGVFQALQTLVPSFNLPARAGGGTSTVIATGGLRGLNPDQTLILINGKRRHKTSLINSVASLYNGSVPADLDLIATAAIERIEVLRDGAAAQYGSDAIAGVINIILKSNHDGGATSVTHGQNFDRDDGDLTQLAADYGLSLGSNGFANLAFSAKEQKLSNRAGKVSPTLRLYPLRPDGSLDPREATIDRMVTRNYGVLPQEGVNFGYNAGYDVGGVSLYSFGTYSSRDSDLPFTYRPASNVNSLPQVYPDGFRPTLLIEEDDFEFAVGARGDLGGWAWDLSTAYGRNQADERSVGNINGSLGPTSPTSFYIGSLESSEWVNSLDVTRPLALFGRDLQVSFGAQHRHETYSIGAGDAASYAAGSYVIPAGQPLAGQRPAPGAQATPGFQPADASDSSRNNYAAYAELGYNPTDKLFLGVAGRYEYYDEPSDSTVIGKVNGRYEFTDWLAARGAVSTGFRAPGLAQQNYASTTSQFRLVNNVLGLLLIKTLPVGSAEAVALGAEPLEPETSTNYSFGITLTPARALSITIDAYQIDVDDRIAITSILTGAAVSNILVANGLSGNISAQYYTNAIDTRTRGVDVVAAWRHDIGAAGQLRWNVGYNYNETKITGIAPNPSELNALGANFVLFDRLSRGNLTAAIPRDKVALGLNWDWNSLNVNTRATRYDRFTVEQNNPANDRTFGAKWITDLEVNYRLNSSLALAIGSNNLFNEYPDANAIPNADTAAGQYGGLSPFGFTGGFYYVRAQVYF